MKKLFSVPALLLVLFLFSQAAAHGNHVVDETDDRCSGSCLTSAVPYKTNKTRVYKTTVYTDVEKCTGAFWWRECKTVHEVRDRFSDSLPAGCCSVASVGLPEARWDLSTQAGTFAVIRHASVSCSDVGALGFLGRLRSAVSAGIESLSLFA